jgi:hypothetical protein
MLMRAESRYDAVWQAIAPYLRVRKNDVHVPLSFAFLQRLLEAHPEAEEDVCVLALVLHDAGWHSVDGPDLIENAFGGTDFMNSDTRYLHEAESCRMAREVLGALGWSTGVIEQVCEIIDGHDTRSVPRHLNDRIVRDADKLWRFTVAGVAIGCDWLKMTPHRFADTLEARVLPLMETVPGRRMAEAELAATRKVLKLDLI